MLCSVIVDLVAEELESTKYATVKSEDCSEALGVVSECTSDVCFPSVSSGSWDAKTSIKLRRWCGLREGTLAHGVRWRDTLDFGGGRGLFCPGNKSCMYFLEIASDGLVPVA
jgi:hypothetical protein